MCSYANLQTLYTTKLFKKGRAYLLFGIRRKLYVRNEFH